MSNPVYEFGGRADVLIKSAYGTTIADKTYSAGEPYTYLRDVFVQFEYANREKLQTGRTNIYDTRYGYPSSVVITGVPLTKKICQLILSQGGTSTVLTANTTATCEENGVLVIPDEIDTSLGDVYILHGEDTVTYSNISGYIITGEFIKDERYLVFYPKTISGDGYKFETPTFPYFALEIFGKGNSDKVTQRLYLKFNAASLVSVPQFDILDGGILQAPLRFGLVYQGQEEPVIMFR